MVGVVVLIVAIVALRDPKNPSAQADGSRTATRTTTSSGPTTPKTKTSTSTSTSPPTPQTTSPGPTVAQLKSDVPLVVLNSTSITGLAAEAAQQFESGGWTVSSTGNLVNDIISTCAYYDPSVAHAKAAATALQREFPTIKRVEPKFEGLADGPVVVVLTDDYSND